MNVYYRFLLMFQCLPLAAVVSTAYGDIFACHGGISPHLLSVEDIDRLDRFVEPEVDQRTGLMDLLWADPVQEDAAERSEEEQSQFLQIRWEKNPTRGVTAVC